MLEYAVMDLKEALCVVATHVRRGEPGQLSGIWDPCEVCRTYVEDERGHTVIAKWPCDPVIFARRVLRHDAETKRKSASPPPVIPTGVPTRKTTVDQKESRVSLEFDAKPAKDFGKVEVTVSDGNHDLYEVEDMGADDARLLGLKLIRAADASERRGW